MLTVTMCFDQYTFEVQKVFRLIRIECGHIPSAVADQDNLRKR